MSELRTAEELAGEWIALNPDAPEMSVVLALMDRIDYLRTQLQTTSAAYVKAAEESATLRRDIRGETDRYIAARLNEIRAAIKAVQDAASDFQVAIDEDWR